MRVLEVLQRVDHRDQVELRIDRRQRTDEEFAEPIDLLQPFSLTVVQILPEQLPALKRLTHRLQRNTCTASDVEGGSVRGKSCRS